MPVRIRPYAPLRDANAVFTLWEETLGSTYPVSERAFRARAVDNLLMEPGDGVVAVDGRRVVGFGLAEIGRHAVGVREGASLAALLVAPECQRQGIGTQLLTAVEKRVREAGCRTVSPGAGLYRFWSGVPEDLGGARTFLVKHGYDFNRRVPDMTIPLGTYALSPQYRQELEQAGCRIVNGTPDLMGPLFTFQQREFPGWSGNMLALLNAGDAENILMVMHGDEVIGSITSFTPASRFRGANLVWERIFGEHLGGYGAVGIANAWRGKGLGAAMSQAAAVHAQNRGATVCYIDWVGPADFYAKLGASVWRWFDQATKALSCSVQL